MTQWNRWLAVTTLALVFAAGCKKNADKPAEGSAKPGSEQVAAAPAGDKGKAAADDDAEKRIPEGCDSKFKQPIEANYTLKKDCSPFTLERTLEVSNWDLTIEPGVELRMGPEGMLEAGRHGQGRINARGTAEAPIRIVSATRKEPGSHRGILLDTHSWGSVLEHLFIEHAGADDTAAIRVHTHDVEIRNVNVIATAGVAYSEEENQRGKTKVFVDNDFSEAGSSEVVAEFHFQSAGALKGANKFPKKSVIRLSGHVRDNLSLPNPGIPYRLHDRTDIDGEDGTGATLSIAPGTGRSIPRSRRRRSTGP